VLYIKYLIFAFGGVFYIYHDNNGNRCSGAKNRSYLWDLLKVNGVLTNRLFTLDKLYLGTPRVNKKIKISKIFSTRVTFLSYIKLILISNRSMLHRLLL